MNILKKLISGGGGGKKEPNKSNKNTSNDTNENVEDDYEPEHCETDFDQQFEHARRSISTTTVPTITHCEYRGSPSRSNRSTPNQSGNLKSGRSTKSPSPLQPPTTQRPRFQSSPLAAANSVAVRKSSKSTPLMQRKSQTPEKPGVSTGKDSVQRNMTMTQQKQAKDFVESLDWIQPTQQVSSSVIQPQVVQSQMIVPQIHICEALPVARPSKAVTAVIPQKRSGIPVPVAASGRVVNINK
uniref:Candidate secreted effector n=1 Tax=Meloidogyne incognita TaxID=6306 RepID=A0A914L9B6_MELIC